MKSGMRADQRNRKVSGRSDKLSNKSQEMNNMMYDSEKDLAGVNRGSKLKGD